MTRRSLGALCGLVSLLAATPALAAAGNAVDRAGVVSRDRALETLRSRSSKAGDALRIHEGAFGMPRYLSGKLSDARPAGMAVDAFARKFLEGQRSLFPMGASELRLAQVIDDKAGGKHVRFDQYYRGVRVWNSDLVVHLDRGGVVRGVSGDGVADLRIDARPTISAEDAMELAEDLVGGALYPVQRASLYVYPMRAGHRLAYQVPVSIDAGPRVFWIDAHTGALILSENPLRDAATTGSGVNVDGEKIQPLNMVSGKFFPVEVSPLFSVYIQSAGKGRFNLVDLTTKDQGYIYTFTSNETYLMNIDYVNSFDNSFDSTNGDSHRSGVSAHDYFRQTLDFYETVYNRKGIDGKGLNVSAVVQVDGLPGVPLECNAGWLGYGFNFMMFGMGGTCGSMGEFKPFSAGLDVIGHELNHGVNEFTINLGYNHEAGALNESFADVFGVLDESYNQDHDWLIGEDLPENPVAPYDAFRSFEDPTKYNQPDHMDTYFTAPVSYDAGGVHFNSGVTNKAFYLMVEGGTFHGVTVPKLASTREAGLDLAGDLWYDVMNSQRISAISQFIDVRDALIDAAEMLNPAALPSIEAAFQAVGVVNDLYPTATQDKTESNEYPPLAVPLTVGATTSGLIWDRNDTDIYAVNLNNNQAVKVTLSKLAFEAQLNVYSVGPYSTLTSEAVSDNAGTADESISFTAKSAGTYYIEVVPNKNRGSRTQPYSLSVIKG